MNSTTISYLQYIYSKLAPKFVRNSDCRLHRPSSIQGWQLLGLFAGYFPCSVVLQPYIEQHLTEIAQDNQHPFHGRRTHTHTYTWYLIYSAAGDDSFNARALNNICPQSWRQCHWKTLRGLSLLVVAVTSPQLQRWRLFWQVFPHIHSTKACHSMFQHFCSTYSIADFEFGLVLCRLVRLFEIF